MQKNFECIIKASVSIDYYNVLPYSLIELVQSTWSSIVSALHVKYNNIIHMENTLRLNDHHYSVGYVSFMCSTEYLSIYIYILPSTLSRLYLLHNGTCERHIILVIY